MGDELKSNLANYKSQLQQVEAALTSDTQNEDLLKLKKDLQEVIDLTQDLITSQEALPEPILATSSAQGAATASASAAAPSHKWNVGDHCMAIYSLDQQYYEATIDEIIDDGSCTITFESYGNTDVTQISLLKPREENEEGPASKRPKTKRDMIADEREYKRKKSQKKAARRKELEEERESEKNKWISFNSKVFSKTSKGKVKKSIFASPEEVGGRVGVGTCGVSGKPMTKYTGMEKWKK